jgi:myo-inositol-1(or 4)-monophosphatase
MSTDTDSYQEYLDFAVALARRAGGIAAHYFRTELTTNWKEDNTPVTAADIEVNEHINGAISAAYPDHGIISEEVPSTFTNQPFVWIVDPIDGTRAFSSAVPTFSISIALHQDGKPLVGVVYQPIAGHMFTAILGQGAWLNGEPIKVNGAVSLSRQYVALTTNLLGATARSTGQMIDAIHELEGRHFAIHSYAYEVCLVAAGYFAGAIIGPNCKPWDIAACGLIVQEAGGNFTDLNGDQINWLDTKTGALATNGILHGQFLDLLHSEA